MSKAAGAIDPKDQATVDEAVKQFDNELGALFAQYGNATIADLMKKKFEDPSGGYTKLDKIDQVKVTVKATDKPETIGTDGVIHYVASDTIPHRSPSSPKITPIGTPQNPIPVSPISRPLKIPIIVTMPNFLTLVKNSMNGMPVIKDHNAPRIGKKIGTKPTGMATQQPITK